MLHATLCEIERGLFHVSYRMEGAGLGKHQLPLYQVGSCAAEVRLLIEHQVRESGYTSITWDEPLPDAPIHEPVSDPGARLTV